MWRSMLFVPTLEDRFVAKAASRGADAIVLDLEASITDDRKDEARAVLPTAVAKLTAEIPVTVRINPLWMAAIRDLEACVMQGVAAIHLARCESAEHVRTIDGIVTDLEVQRGLPHRQIKLIAIIESANALTNAAEIAKASPRMIGMTLGVEDFATSMGVRATPELLRPAVCQLNHAACATGIISFAVPCSMADYKDIEALETQASYARKIGTVGGYAVHPAQVTVLNARFSSSPDEIAWAQEVIHAAELATQHGQGIVKVRGQMIDLPLITRAKRLLDKS